MHIALSYDEKVGCLGVRPMRDELQRWGDLVQKLGLPMRDGGGGSRARGSLDRVGPPR